MILSLFIRYQRIYVLPTVKEECERISDMKRRLEHEMIIQILLRNRSWKLDNLQLEIRKNNFLLYHNKETDCRILAELKVQG